MKTAMVIVMNVNTLVGSIMKNNFTSYNSDYLQAV
jgi:hypothetical protein